MKNVLVIGIGAGDPDYVTMQAIKALNEVDVFFVIDKGEAKDDLARLRREICERYGLTYTTGPLRKQYGNVLRKINRYALPRREERAAALARTQQAVAALVPRPAPETASAAKQPVRLAS